MITTTVSESGRIIIPAILRKKYGIEKGTKVQFIEKNGKIVILTLTEKMIDNNIGLLKTKGKLLKKLLKEKSS